MTHNILPSLNRISQRVARLLVLLIVMLLGATACNQTEKTQSQEILIDTSELTEDIQPLTNVQAIATSGTDASCNATIYESDGTWYGTGRLIETSDKAYIQIQKERYELTASDRDDYRYYITSEKLYVK